MVQHIVDQSNGYTEQVMSPTTFQEWTPLTPREFEAFVGVNILMGINHLPSLEDYWKRDDIYNYHQAGQSATTVGVPARSLFRGVHPWPGAGCRRGHDKVSSLKLYMPKKPIKRDIKVWVHADSHTGFFSQLEV